MGISPETLFLRNPAKDFRFSCIPPQAEGFGRSPSRCRAQPDRQSERLPQATATGIGERSDTRFLSLSVLVNQSLCYSKTFRAAGKREKSGVFPGFSKYFGKNGEFSQKTCLITWKTGKNSHLMNQKSGNMGCYSGKLKFFQGIKNFFPDFPFF